MVDNGISMRGRLVALAEALDQLSGIEKYSGTAVELNLQKLWTNPAESSVKLALERRIAGLMTPSWPWNGVLGGPAVPSWPWNDVLVALAAPDTALWAPRRRHGCFETVVYAKKSMRFFP